MNIAFVHDFLLYWGGAERVVKGLTSIFPGAPLYTLFYNPRFTNTWFPDVSIRTSSLQPFWRARRLLLPALPTNAESLNLDAYDVVISSGVFSKGIIVKPGTRHIHYCHTPARFLWEESRQYVTTSVPFGLRTLAMGLLHPLRLWDYQAAQRPDIMLANSPWTAKKIKKLYRREATVIYPFFNSKFKNEYSHELQNAIRRGGQFKIQNYFLIVSRLQKYKQIDLAINVFNDLKLPLVIAGMGADEKRLKRLAGGTITFTGFVAEDELVHLYRNARAVILPGIEDFGLVPIEAMAQGTPVLAYRKGGAKETIIEGKTGEFFDELTPQNFYQGFQKLLEHEKQYNKKNITRHAQKFSFERFKRKVLSILESTI